MNALKIFRNSNLIVCTSLLILIVSCTQYDINNVSRSFDYSIYDDYKNDSSKIKLNNNFGDLLYRTSIGDQNYAILQDINKEYETNIVLPDDFLDLHLDMSSQEIQNKCLQLGYVTQQDLTLVNAFYENLENDGFNSAIDDFEDDVIALNLSNQEFERYNVFANSLKILNNEINFDEYVSRGWLACLTSVVSLGIAAFNLWTCLTPTRCILSFVAYVIAALNVAINCNVDNFE